MATMKLDRAGIRQIKKMLDRSVAVTTANCGKMAYRYFVSEYESNPVYTGYFRSNWNCSVNGINTAVAPEKRDAKEFYFWDLDKAETAFSAVATSDAVYVTNSVPYVKVLNNGGVFPDGRIYEPKRFIELCMGYIAANANIIVQQSRKEIEENYS